MTNAWHNNDDEAPEVWDDQPPAPSKSHIKRELHALQNLGGELVQLSDGWLAKLPLSDELLKAVKEAQRLKKGALKRQLQFIGKLMRSADADAIQTGLDNLRQPQREDVARFHQLEAWRDALVAGDEEMLTVIIDELPGIDSQHLRQLMRNAIRERDQNKPPKTARQLFQYLKTQSAV
jgi:ribosome-associated protein